MEKTKTTQALEINSLKRWVKKLEKKQRSRTHKLKRLYKVGLSARVESSNDNEDLGEDASKQGRKIHDINADEDITLVNDQDDEQMFDVNDLQGEEVFVQEDVANKKVNAAGKVNVVIITITISAVATITTEEVTLAKALAELKASKPNVKGVFIQEPSESLTTTTISSKKSQDKGRAIMLKNILARESAQKEQEVNSALIEEWNDIQAKIDVDYLLAQRLQAEEQQELTIAEKATLFMQFLEKRRKFFAAKRAEEKRNRPPTRAQKGVSSMKRVNTLVDYNTESVEKSSKKAEAELMEGSSKRVGIELEQESSKKQKIDDDKETTELKQLVKIIPDEEGVAIDAIPLAVKPPSIVDWKIHKGGKSYYKIIRADGSLKIYLVFSHMIKSFEKEDVKTLWKLVKAKHGSTRPEEDYERVL
nr:hypothetical protein [Tanacetum cinerariifolium]